MLHRLCGPPSIPLSFILANVLPRWLTYRFPLDAQSYRSNIELTSFRAWTTRVSNPVRSPRFRASASIKTQLAAFAIGIPQHIYAFHRNMSHSTNLYLIQVTQFQRPSHSRAVTFHL